MFHENNLLKQYHKDLREERTISMLQANAAATTLIKVKKEAKLRAEVASKMKRQKVRAERKRQKQEAAEQARLVELERLKIEEENRWKPKSDPDRFCFPKIINWGKDFRAPPEKFYHAAFVLPWFVHRKYGLCFTGGIERWGKDKNKLKQFGGRREKGLNETREQTASRELNEETCGLATMSPEELSREPHVFSLRTNPVYLVNIEVNPYDFRNLVQQQKDPHCQEMKAIVNIPYSEFYYYNFRGGIPKNGIRLKDVTGRRTQISAFYLHALEAFGLLP